jgi:hypothetical protein
MTITIDDRSVSAAHVTRQFMVRLLEEDPEAWARLSGLMATLALPPLRHFDGSSRKPSVEIEITPGVWALVDALAIESNRLLFWYGENGTRREYVFPKAAGIPRWRTVERGRPSSQLEVNG